LIEKGITKTIKTSTGNYLSQKNITVIDISHNPKKIGIPFTAHKKRKVTMYFPLPECRKD